MNYILFDDQQRDNFLPLSFTNTVADLLIGMFTNRERWEVYCERKTSSISDISLKKKFPVHIEEDNILINSRLLPDKNVFNELKSLNKGQKLISDSDVLGIRIGEKELREILAKAGDTESLSYPQAISKADVSATKTNFNVKLISQLWDFFTLNGEVMNADVRLLDKSNFKNNGGDANQFIGKEIYIHNTAKVNGAIFNSTSGPIVIDEGAEVMEGSILRGPIYIGKNAGVKMAAKIYGPTSVGTFSKVGGEINNSVINGFSNKGHDGFLGNSVLGYWCNLGADTNTSNLKNDYSIVKLWNYQKESFVKSGLQFLGLVMGDHSKCGINTMFNTGTVVGVSCNVYGSGFQPNMIPSFSWGKPGSFTTYQFEKAMQVAQRVMERRDKNLDGTEEMLMKEVFEKTENLRNKFH